MQSSQTLFREVQSFREWRLWFLLVLAAFAPVPLFVWGMVRQFVQDRPWGEPPMSDLSLALVGTGMIAFSLASTWLLWRLDLTTEVRADGLHVRLFPFPRK